MNATGLGPRFVLGALSFAASAYATALSGAPARPTVVLADFDDATGDERLDRSHTQALLLELSQSPFLSLLPERGVTDAPQAMGRLQARAEYRSLPYPGGQS